MKTKFALPLALAITIAACSDTREVETETSQVGAVTEAGLAISGGRMVMPAVSGNPGVVYFTAENTTEADVSLVAIDVAGAGRTEMHDMVMADGAMRMEQMETVQIASSATAKFASGGKHVMVFDLDPGLGAGGETEVTLILGNGDKASFTVPVGAAGEDR